MKEYKEQIMELREFMKGYTQLEENYESPQDANAEQPPLEVSYGRILKTDGIDTTDAGKIIVLPTEFKAIIKNNDILSILSNRTSRRQYSNEPLSLEELSFLLWSTQGVKKVIGKTRKATLRTVPSAGARHPFETYLFLNHVTGLKQGIYHYLSLEHKLEYLGVLTNQSDRVSAAFCGQTFFGSAAVSFVWTVIPYRSEWRYTTKAQKYSLIDVGHLCENLYIACEAIGCGTCGIGAYEQALADELLDLNTNPSAENNNEFVIYAACVGKIDLVPIS